MRILITNDDGIHSPGLDLLERIAQTLSDDVYVIAPEYDQSGVAHSLSLNDPLRLRAGPRRRRSPQDRRTSRRARHSLLLDRLPARRLHAGQGHRSRSARGEKDFADAAAARSHRRECGEALRAGLCAEKARAEDGAIAVIVIAAKAA